MTFKTVLFVKKDAEKYLQANLTEFTPVLSGVGKDKP